MGLSNKDILESEWELLRNLGVIFKEIRAESGMTQKEAAAARNSSQSRIPILENGKADIMVTSLSRWAAVYGYELQINLVPIEDEFARSLREAVEALQEEQDAGQAEPNDARAARDDGGAPRVA